MNSISRSQKISCPKCRADMTDAIPANCAAHLHPQLILAYASIKRQFAPRRAFDGKSILPKQKPYYLDFSSPIGERALIERIEEDDWNENGKKTLHACYPDY